MKRLALALLLSLTLPAAAEDYFVYAGSYTDPPSTAKGIYAWRFSPDKDTLTPLGLVAETVNPAYVAATPDGRFLYAVNWQTPTPPRAIRSAPSPLTPRPASSAFSTR